MQSRSNQEQRPKPSSRESYQDRRNAAINEEHEDVPHRRGGALFGVPEQRLQPVPNARRRIVDMEESLGDDFSEQNQEAQRQERDQQPLGPAEQIGAIAWPRLKRIADIKENQPAE